MLLLSVLAWRGPGGYWFAFWTEPVVRSAYVVVAVVLAGWVLAALVWSLAVRSGSRPRTSRTANTLFCGLGPG